MRAIARQHVPLEDVGECRPRRLGRVVPGWFTDLATPFQQPCTPLGLVALPLAGWPQPSQRRAA